MKYIQHYSQKIQQEVQHLIDTNTLGIYLTSKYKQHHLINNDKALYEYVMQYKNQYFKKHQLSKVCFDGKINVINNALGMHTFISRVQGNKLKAKNEIRIATLFKKTPLEFLNMIIVHELAHLKQKEHNKAFYRLCVHMQSEYFQAELDFRLYLMHKELNKAPY